MALRRGQSRKWFARSAATSDEHLTTLTQRRLDSLRSDVALRRERELRTQVLDAYRRLDEASERLVAAVARLVEARAAWSELYETARTLSELHLGAAAKARLEALPPPATPPWPDRGRHPALWKLLQPESTLESPDAQRLGAELQDWISSWEHPASREDPPLLEENRTGSGDTRVEKREPAGDQESSGDEEVEADPDSTAVEFRETKEEADQPWEPAVPDASCQPSGACRERQTLSRAMEANEGEEPVIDWTGLEPDRQPHPRLAGQEEDGCPPPDSHRLRAPGKVTRAQTRPPLSSPRVDGEQKDDATRPAAGESSPGSGTGPSSGDGMPPPEPVPFLKKRPDVDATPSTAAAPEPEFAADDSAFDV